MGRPRSQSRKGNRTARRPHREEVTNNDPPPFPFEFHQTVTMQRPRFQRAVIINRCANPEASKGCVPKNNKGNHQALKRKRGKTGKPGKPGKVGKPHKKRKKK